MNSSSEMGLGSAYFRSVACDLSHKVWFVPWSEGPWWFLSWRPFYTFQRRLTAWKILGVYFNGEATRALCSGFPKGMIQMAWLFHQLWTHAEKFSCTLIVETNMEGLDRMTSRWFKPPLSDQFAFQTLNNLLPKDGHFIFMLWQSHFGVSCKLWFSIKAAGVSLSVILRLCEASLWNVDWPPGMGLYACSPIAMHILLICAHIYYYTSPIQLYYYLFS